MAVKAIERVTCPNRYTILRALQYSEATVKMGIPTVTTSGTTCVVRWKNNWELNTVPPELILSEAGRINALRRQTIKGGRPLSDKPRCQCGKYTIHTAEARRHKCKLPTASEAEQVQAEVKKPTVDKQ